MPKVVETHSRQPCSFQETNEIAVEVSRLDWRTSPRGEDQTQILPIWARREAIFELTNLVCSKRFCCRAWHAECATRPRGLRLYQHEFAVMTTPNTLDSLINGKSAPV